MYYYLQKNVLLFTKNKFLVVLEELFLVGANASSYSFDY